MNKMSRWASTTARLFEKSDATNTTASEVGGPPAIDEGGGEGEQP